MLSGHIYNNANRPTAASAQIDAVDGAPGKGDVLDTNAAGMRA